MKSTISALALALGLACSASGHAAAVTYSFLAPFNAGFHLTVANPVTSDTSFAASALTDCWVFASTCDSVTFYMNAEAAGLGPKPEWEAIGVSTNHHQTTYYFYFSGAAFQTLGMHPSTDGANFASLNVSAVPEPASLALLCAGLGLLGGLARRRSRRRSEISSL